MYCGYKVCEKMQQTMQGRVDSKMMMVEGGWSVEFHSCVDICIMRGVVGCKHDRQG